MAKVRISDMVVTPYASGLGCLNNDDLYITYQIVAQFANIRWGKSLYKKSFMHMNVFVFKLM